jgi:hypothetical protein
MLSQKETIQEEEVDDQMVSLFPAIRIDETLRSKEQKTP